MSFHRTILVAVATLFTVVMTSGAFAGCCGWGASEPVVYASSGCGGCGLSYDPTYATPMAVAPITVGCGGCGVPTAAVVFAQPVAAVYGGGGCCGGCGGCGASYMYGAPAITPVAPIYVVNQGPEYTGPGMMVPYRHYPSAMSPYAGSSSYPYIYRPHRYFGPRYAYGPRPYMGPRYLGPRWHSRMY